MSFQYWSKGLILLTILFFILISGINYIVNPYQIFNHTLFSNFFKTKQHGVSARMKIFYDAKRSSASNFVIGSSRVGLLPSEKISQYLQGTTFNMAIPGTNIEEQTQYILYIINNKKIQNIIWGLDFYSFNPDLSNDPDFSYNRLESSPLLNSDYKTSLLSLQATNNSFKTVIDNLRLSFKKEKPKEKHKEKSFAVAKKEQLDILNSLSKKQVQEKTDRQLAFYPKKFFQYKTFNDPESIKDNLKKVKEVLDLCEKKNIDIYIYTNPVHTSFINMYYALGLENTFLAWKKGIAEISSYTDFANNNSVTQNLYNFLDGSHIIPKYGDLVLARIFQDKSVKVPEDFGIYIQKQ